MFFLGCAYARIARLGSDLEIALLMKCIARRLRTSGQAASICRLQKACDQRFSMLLIIRCLLISILSYVHDYDARDHDDGGSGSDWPVASHSGGGRRGVGMQQREAEQAQARKNSCAAVLRTASARAKDCFLLSPPSLARASMVTIRQVTPNKHRNELRLASVGMISILEKKEFAVYSVGTVPKRIWPICSVQIEDL